MWTVFANIGDAAVTLPVAALCGWWIGGSSSWLACRWLIALASGMALVGATKVLYAAWSLSLPIDHFRMISGHAMLSTAVWIVALALLFKIWRVAPLPGVLAGMTIGAMTGVARVMDLSHSRAEVALGCIVGAAVALPTLHALKSLQFDGRRPIWATLTLLAVSALAYGHKAPFQDLLTEHAGTPRIHAFSALHNRLRF
jgi:hypothetical protein